MKTHTKLLTQHGSPASFDDIWISGRAFRSETGKLNRIENNPRNLNAFVVLAEFPVPVLSSSWLSSWLSASESFSASDPSTSEWYVRITFFLVRAILRFGWWVFETMYCKRTREQLLFLNNNSKIKVHLVSQKSTWLVSNMTWIVKNKKLKCIWLVKRAPD